MSLFDEPLDNVMSMLCLLGDNYWGDQAVANKARRTLP
jgi:hypothetical protein